MADQLKRIADKLDGGDPNVGKPTEEGNLKRIADYIVENGMGGGDDIAWFMFKIESHESGTGTTVTLEGATQEEIEAAVESGKKMFALVKEYNKNFDGVVSTWTAPILYDHMYKIIDIGHVGTNGNIIYVYNISQTPTKEFVYTTASVNV